MKKLSRRTLLRGAGGAAISLPLLEIMLDSRGKLYAQSAAATPKRYVVCFGGQSLGGDGDPLHNDYVPNTVGARLRSQERARAAAARAGGRQRRVGAVDPDGERRHGPGGRAARRLPRVVAEPAAVGRAIAVEHGVGRRDVGSARGGGDRGDDAVQVAGLPHPGRMVPGRVGALRPRHDLVQGRTRRAAPRCRSRRRSARRWRSTPCSTTSRRRTTRRRPRARTSCCAAARACSTWSAATCTKLTSNAQLGRADQQRLSRHLDEIRDLERQISTAPPVVTATCQKLPAPGVDPALGGNQGVDANGENTYATNLGYSGEEERAQDLHRPGAHGADLRPDARRVAAVHDVPVAPQHVPADRPPLRPARDRPRRRSRPARGRWGSARGSRGT